MAPTTTLHPGDTVAADLAAWVVHRDRSALERALEQAAAWAQPQARRLLGHASDADDAVQEALVQVVRSAHRYDPQRPFRPWLARIVHDACARLLRARSRRRRHEGAAPPPAGDDPHDPEIQAEVRAVVLALPESLRAAIDLHYFADLSQAQAAEALGISENACAVRLNRARNRLRDLFLRRGLRIGAVAALTALGNQASAATMPVGLAASIAAQAAGGILPTTTIPLSLTQKIGALVSAHPLASAGIACALGVLAISPAFTADAPSEAPAPVVTPAPAQTPPPPVVAAPRRSDTHWIDESAGLLPFVDTSAPFSFAADIASLRKVSATTKPLSLFHEAEIQAWFARLEEGNAAQGPSPNRTDPALYILAKALITEGSGLAVSMRDTSQGNRLEERMLTILDLGTRVQEVVTALSGMDRSVGDIGPFTGIGQEDGVLYFGHDARRLVIAAQPWLRSQIQSGGQSPVFTAPVHLRVDASPLVARYAERSGPNADPAEVAAVLGPEWRSLKPQVNGTLRVVEDTLRSDLTVSGARTFSPLLPLSLILGSTTTLPLGKYAAVRMRAPGIAIPDQANALMTTQAGFVVEDAFDPNQLPDSPLRHALLAVHGWWDGDLALNIRAGVPLPQAAVSFGIRPGQDPSTALSVIATALGAGITTQPEAGFIDEVATLPSPMGLVTLRAAADRVVILVNSEAGTWPGIADAIAAVGAAPCTMEADLAAILRTAWPFVLMGVPAQERQNLPKAETLARNLPIWRMTWSATADGCRIEESGLPLVSLLVGLASVRTIAEADPVREIEVAPQPANLSDF